jgi:Uma2 family endonuclease
VRIFTKNYVGGAMQILTHKFNVEQYHQMGEASIFAPGVRLELIQGEIVDMTPIGLKHAIAINRLNYLLTLRVRDRGIISIQNSIRLNNYSEPQPDVVILRHRQDFYANKFPAAEDVLLLVEVSDSSLKYDREVKVPLYAKSNIPETWVIDLNQEIIEIYRHPIENIYTLKQVINAGQSFSPVAFPDINLTPSDIFG